MFVSWNLLLRIIRLCVKTSRDVDSSGSAAQRAKCGQRVHASVIAGRRHRIYRKLRFESASRNRRGTGGVRDQRSSGPLTSRTSDKQSAFGSGVLALLVQKAGGAEASCGRPDAA